jgi:hypothetical protein
MFLRLLPYEIVNGSGCSRAWRIATAPAIHRRGRHATSKPFNSAMSVEKAQSTLPAIAYNLKKSLSLSPHYPANQPMRH